MRLPRQENIQHIADRLNVLSDIIKTRSRAGFTDANRILETIAARFFNALFGWELVNLNAEQTGYPAVDLGDRSNRISIQVTNEKRSDKISKTASKASAHKQDTEFDRLIIFFLLPEKPGFPRNFSPLPDCPEVETWDIPDLLKQINELDLTRLAVAAQILDEEMGRIPQQNPSSAINTPQESKYPGKQRNELLQYFLADWLVKGPPVAILQGFPGSGKTQLSREIEERSGLQSFKVYIQSDAPNLSESPLEALAEELELSGIVDLVRELDKGAHGDLFKALLRILRREPILIVIDEFQLLFGDRNTLPPKKWQQLVEELNSRATPKGRLLLISNRAINIAPWCERCVSRQLDGLTDKEAADLLREQLDRDGLTEKFPLDRMTEIGHRLGGNPRALITLVKSLAYDSLEELISLAPDLFKPGDVTIDHSLVEQFERNLIERTLPRIDEDLTTLLRFLAVHRRPFTKEVYTGLENRIPTALLLRRQLIDRFLLDNSPAWDSLHPLAREVSVSRLRKSADEWHQVHSMAADYHFRHFKARQLKGVQRLTVSYIELRHHLLAADRMAELGEADSKLTNYALAQITPPVQSTIPRSVETLEERIALITAMPDNKRPKGLEYHLALCLKHRNVGDDYRKALFHVHRAVGRHAYYAAWLLLIDLEYALNGLDAMIKAQNQAVHNLGSGSNAFAIYHHCADILDRDNRSNDAINLLEKAINTPGIACISSLRSLCARYLEKAGRLDDAIKILETGIDTPKVPEREIVYMNCAKLMVKEGRRDDAISLLKKGIDTIDIAKPNHLYLFLAELLANDEQAKDAIALLKQGISDKRVTDSQSLYRYCAELLVKDDRSDEAISLLEEGMASRVIRNPLPLCHSFVEIKERAGKPLEGTQFLISAMSNARLKTESSIYLACAKLYFKAREIHAAIEVLKRGLAVPKIKDQNQLIQMCADLLARKGHSDEAIKMLENGISENESSFVYPLYHTCSELMVKAGRLEDAIFLMKKGIDAPALTNKAVLYQSCAKLLDKAKRPEEAIDLLKKAISLPGMTGQVILYQILAKLLNEVDRQHEAIQILKTAINGPKMGNVVSLYYVCAELMLSIGSNDDAIQILKEGMASYPKDRHLQDIHKKTMVH